MNLKGLHCPICNKTPHMWNHRSEFGISKVCDIYCSCGIKITCNEDEVIDKWKELGNYKVYDDWA